MADEPEVIRQQMEETRTSLTEKLETLEQQVVETVQGATSAVTETVENVKEAVQDTVSTVKDTFQDTVETVKETFNLSRQVDRHPWLMFGGAVAVGYLGGRLLLPRGPSYSYSIGRRPGAGRSFRPPYRGAAHAPLGAPESEAPPTGTGESWLGSLAGRFESEINQLKGLAIGAVMSLVRDALAHSAPPEVGVQLAGVVDSVTEKLGGHPLKHSIRQHPAPERSSSGGAYQEQFGTMEAVRQTERVPGQAQHALE